MPASQIEADVLIVPGVPPEVAVTLVTLDGRPGFTTMTADDLASFQPTDDARPPGGSYVLVGVDVGMAYRGIRPNDGLPEILAAGRSPLTLQEGLAVAQRHPEWLRVSARRTTQRCESVPHLSRWVLGRWDGRRC